MLFAANFSRVKPPFFPGEPRGSPGAAAAREDDSTTVRLGSCRVLAQALRGGELPKAAEATAVGWIFPVFFFGFQTFSSHLIIG